MLLQPDLWPADPRRKQSKLFPPLPFFLGPSPACHTWGHWSQCHTCSMNRRAVFGYTWQKSDAHTDVRARDLHLLAVVLVQVHQQHALAVVQAELVKGAVAVDGRPRHTGAPSDFPWNSSQSNSLFWRLPVGLMVKPQISATAAVFALQRVVFADMKASLFVWFVTKNHREVQSVTSARCHGRTVIV